MRTALGFTLLSMDLIHSFSPGNGGGGQLVAIRSSSVFFGGGLQVEQRFLNDFQSLHYPMTEDPVLSQTFAKWGSSMTGWKNVTIPLSMELGMETRESGATDWTAAFRGTAGWKGWTGTLEGYRSIGGGGRRGDAAIEHPVRGKRLLSVQDGEAGQIPGSRSRDGADATGGDLVSGQDFFLQPTGPTAGKALGAAAAASD